jgi:hypothetical protein
MREAKQPGLNALCEEAAEKATFPGESIRKLESAQARDDLLRPAVYRTCVFCAQAAGWWICGACAAETPARPSGGGSRRPDVCAEQPRRK